MACKKCDGRGFTNKPVATGTQEIEWDPPVMVICECSKGEPRPREEDAAMNWSPRFVARPQVPCWPWHLRMSMESEGHPIGDQCACGKEVALPRQFAGAEAVCLYCALDSGLLPSTEEPPDDRPLHAIATEAQRAASEAAVHEGAGLGEASPKGGPA